MTDELIKPDIEKILSVWAATPLCNGMWTEGNSVYREETADYEYRITRLCPIAALLRAAGISNQDLKLLSQYYEPDQVYAKYGHILRDQYGISFDLFDAIVSGVDDHGSLTETEVRVEATTLLQEFQP